MNFAQIQQSQSSSLPFILTFSHFVSLLIQMESDLDQFQDEPERQPPKVEYEEEEIRVSSNGSSPNIEESQQNSSISSFEVFDKIVSGEIQPKPKVSPIKPQLKEEPEDEPGGGKKEAIVGQVGGECIIQQVEKEWIIKEAERQRIGGTYDFFSIHLDKYKRHLQARKIALLNICAVIDKYKIIKAHPIMLLKEYFKDYSSLCADFHQKCYKYEIPQREETDNKMVNIRIELRTGFERLFNLRKQTGNEISRLQKFMKTTTLTKLDKAVEVYWGVMASHQAKSIAKKEQFEDKERKFQKRLQKISKVYGKGRIGNQIDEDVFEEMAKFVKEERELRYSIYDWGKEILNLRKNAMNSDYGFFTELQAILGQFKNYNDTVYQLQKKKFNFLDRLKLNIEANYLFEKLCTPLDNDYILTVLNFKNKSALALLAQQDYELFINEEYFGDIIGETTEFLKGTIVKTFPLRNPDEELVKTVSGNLVLYNKKTLEVKYRMKAAWTKGEFEGNGCVSLKEVVKGIIFDSENTQKVHFKDDNRAEEIIVFLSGEFCDLP